MSTRTFDVTLLVRPKSGDPTGDASEQTRVDQLMEAIKRTIDPDSWDWVGGSGAIRSHFKAFNVKWFLIVIQSDTNQTAIQGLLTSLNA